MGYIKIFSLLKGLSISTSHFLIELSRYEKIRHNLIKIAIDVGQLTVLFRLFPTFLILNEC